MLLMTQFVMDGNNLERENGFKRRFGSQPDLRTGHLNLSVLQFSYLRKGKNNIYTLVFGRVKGLNQLQARLSKAKTWLFREGNEICRLSNSS